MATRTRTKAKTGGARATTDDRDAAVTAGHEPAERRAKASADAAAKSEESPAALGEEIPRAFVSGYDVVATFGKGNVEALVTAGNAAAKGVEEIGGELMVFTRSTLEDGMAATKAVLGAKSVQEVVELQAGYAQGSLQRFLATSSRLSEMSMTMGSEVLEPVTAQLTRAMERIRRPAGG